MPQMPPKRSPSCGIRKIPETCLAKPGSQSPSFIHHRQLWPIPNGALRVQPSIHGRTNFQEQPSIDIASAFRQWRLRRESLFRNCGARPI